MKKTFLFAALAAVLTLVGCKGEEDPATEGAISVNPTSLSVKSGSSSNDVAVSANGAWTAAVTADWVTLSATSGAGSTSVTIMVSENEASQARSTDVEFICDGAKATVSVEQAAGNGGGGSTGDAFAEITVSDITPVSASIAWSVADQDQTYVIGLFDAGMLESYGYVEDEDIAAAIIGAYDQAGALANYTLTGDNGGNFDQLTPSTGFTFYIFAVDASYSLVSEVCTADFTTGDAEVTPEYEAWAGTWNITSTSSYADGGAITVEAIITDVDGVAVPGVSLDIYGLDISGNRWLLPAIASYDHQTCGWSVNGETYLTSDNEGYDYYSSAICSIDGESEFYFVQGNYPALTATMGSDNESADIACYTGSLQDGRNFTVASVVLCAKQGGSIYSFYPDESLGLDDNEVLVGPFTMEKVSDDTELPQSAPQRVPGFNNVEAKKVSAKIAVNNSFRAFAIAQ